MCVIIIIVHSGLLYHLPIFIFHLIATVLPHLVDIINDILCHHSNVREVLSALIAAPCLE